MLRVSRPVLSLSARAIEARAIAPFASARASLALSSTVQPPRHLARSAWARRVQYSTKIPVGRDKEGEKEVGRQKLESDPEAVTSASSVRKVWEPSEGSSSSEDDVTSGLKSDMETVKDTFSLSSVPPLPLKLGLAGTLPYFGTSISTLYLGWNINTQWPTSSGFLNSFMLSDANAQTLLQHLEAIQLGYGAVIISFLGAIHWGLEYAETKPDRKRTNFRYALGVAAPAVAWPTLLMPVEYALISQFAAFTGLYYFDSRASRRGWAPSWYGTYRFVLTFVVGSAIMASLIGRAKIGDGGNKEAADRISDSKHGRAVREMPEAQWRRLEAEEKEKLRKEAEEAERKKKEEEKQKKKGKKADKGGKGKGKEEKAEGASQQKEEKASKDGEADEGKQDESKEDGAADEDKQEESSEDGDAGKDDKKDDKEDKGDKKDEKKDKGDKKDSKKDSKKDDKKDDTKDDTKEKKQKK